MRLMLEQGRASQSETSHSSQSETSHSYYSENRGYATLMLTLSYATVCDGASVEQWEIFDFCWQLDKGTVEKCNICKEGAEKI